MSAFASKTFTANSQNCDVPCDDSGTVAFLISTDSSWNGTITFRASVDGVQYITVNAVNINTGNPSQTFTTANTNAIFKLGVAGYNFFRLAVTAWSAGTAAVVLKSSNGAQSITLDNPLPAGQNLIGSVMGPAGAGAAVSGNPVWMGGTDGTNVRGIKTDTSGELQVDVLSVNAQTAHDAAIGGAPVRAGGRAVNAEVTAVANGDTADLVTDLTGKQIILPYANPENFLAGKTSDITGTTDTSVIAAQGAGVRIYVTQVTVQNSHATVSTWVDIEDGTSAIYTIYAPAAGGGASVTFPVPLRLTANTALQAKCATTGSNVRVSASGYKGV